MKVENKLSKTVNIAGKVIDKSQKQLFNIFDSAIHRKVKQISADTSHQLHSEFELAIDSEAQELAGTYK